MSRTFTNLLTHMVFSTKDREPLIVPQVKPELLRYLGGLAGKLKGKAYGINGTEDHVHMLVSLPPVVSIADALRFIKPNSSGCSVMERSASASQMFPRCLSILPDRNIHHRRWTFKDEFLDLLRKHEIDYDERPTAYAVGY